MGMSDKVFEEITRGCKKVAEREVKEELAELRRDNKKLEKENFELLGKISKLQNLNNKAISEIGKIKETYYDFYEELRDIVEIRVCDATQETGRLKMWLKNFEVDIKKLRL